MTCGCASEFTGTGYRQYEESECVWCPCCNRIFCQEHGKKHQSHIRGRRMKPMSVEP